MRGFFGLGGLTASDIFLPSEIAFFQKVWPTVRVAAHWTDPRWDLLGYPSGPPISPLSNAIMGAVWGDVRRAAQFSDINWNAVPELTPAMLMAATAVTHPPPVSAPVPEVVQSPPTVSSPSPAPATVPTMRTPEQSPTAQPANVDTSPVASPVPEAQQPTTSYVDGPSTPVNSPGAGSPPMFTDPGYSYTLPTLPPLDQTAPAPAAVTQAGMFGGGSLLYVGLAIGAALLFGTHGHVGKKGGGRRRKRA